MKALFFAGCICIVAALSLPLAAQQQVSDPFGNAAADPFDASPNSSKRVADPAAAKSRHGARTQREGLSTVEQIRFELNQTTSQTFIGESLENVVRTLSKAHDIPILVDKKALEEIGLDSDTPISISLKDVKLRSLLSLALSGLDLTYTTNNEALIITTKKAGDQIPTVEAHTLPESLATRGDKVLAALKLSVRPSDWDSNGGTSTATTIDNVLVVSGPETLHEDVLEFVEKLNVAFERSQKAKQ